MSQITTSGKKVAFITGGGRGLGLETAKGLARLDVDVVLGARDAEQGRRAVELLREEGLSAVFLLHDVVNPDHRASAYDYLDSQYGRLDILVNNAGIWLETENSSVDVPNQTSTLSEDLIRKTFEVNFMAPVLLTQKLLPLIRRSSAGRIVNLSSLQASQTLHSDPESLIYGIKPFAYSASKSALNSLTIHLAQELIDTPIKVNSVHPGWVRTKMGGPAAHLDEESGSRTAIKFATLPDDGPTGGFYYEDEIIPW
jgi:NAD(P)-dependent dehydrogenase (short-subunit alcohol dehydrogenase family)